MKRIAHEASRETVRASQGFRQAFRARARRRPGPGDRRRRIFLLRGGSGAPPATTGGSLLGGRPSCSATERVREDARSWSARSGQHDSRPRTEAADLPHAQARGGGAAAGGEAPAEGARERRWPRARARRQHRWGGGRSQRRPSARSDCDTRDHAEGLRRGGSGLPERSIFTSEMGEASAKVAELTPASSSTTKESRHGDPNSSRGISPGGPGCGERRRISYHSARRNVHWATSLSAMARRRRRCSWRRPIFADGVRKSRPAPARSI